MSRVRRALISVSDKRGVVELARSLAGLDIEILSTGGTAKALAEAEVPVVPVEDFTGFPEMLDGRVKTLHPSIHAGILHRRDDVSHQRAMATHGLKPIDLVIVNLYPFEQTVARPDCSFAEAVENIDIGGPSLLRAAAKNHVDVGVVVDPDDYPAVLEALRTHGTLSTEQKLALAKKAFRLTARYDGVVDANAALELLKEFDPIVAVAIKHTNPCGVATSTVSLADAFRKARACDPVSIFGGIVGLNREVDAETAQEILNLYQEGFLEILLAPRFSPQALEMLASSKRLLNIRLLEIPTLPQPSPMRFEGKHVVGGLLLQERDFGRVRVEDCQVVTRRRPTLTEYRALDFAWRVSKYVKSNAIVLACEDRVVGVGAGQMSRVDPFRDGLDVVARAGATAVIQPGGSLRDKEVIAAADEQGLAMVFTGMRHFRH